MRFDDRRPGYGRDDDRDRYRPSTRRDELREDYGQVDYSNTYGYDPHTRSGYRNFEDDYPGHRPPIRDDEPPVHRRSRRDGPSDRVLWAVITERLDREHRLDLRDVEVDVRDAEVTLNGLVRHKDDKRRIEDIADIDGVRHVQNNLRVRDANRRWTFF